MKQLFKLGKLVSTRTISEELSMEEMFSLIDRHVTGDYGNLTQTDINANKRAINDDERIFSSYDTDHGKIFVITEWDRSVTTVLFASEY